MYIYNNDLYEWLNFIISIDSLVKCNKNFVDIHGYTCQKYFDRRWCSSTGGYHWSYGKNWTVYPGTFEDHSINDETALVCPQCGCYNGRYIL